MTGGKASRAKGDRFEREVVASLEADGIGAERVPLSGAAGGMFSGDIQAITRLGRIKLECKVRARAWLDLYGWIVGNYALVIKRDRDEPLVVMRLSDWKKLAKEDW
jgi:Holliday junction resolvase